MVKIWRALAGAVVVMVVGMVVSSGAAGAAESDLDAGLAYLRAGAQAEAEKHLTRYRDEVRDPEARKRLARVLHLLKRPLSDDLREFLAEAVEDSVRPRPKGRAEVTPPDYLSRIFPVFP